MIVVFVHGWSVRNTDTNGQLPARLKQAATELDIVDIWLGKYISFDDSVTVDDIARAFQQALTDSVFPRLKPGERFACITHSTGGPVARTWLDLFYGPDTPGAKALNECPMSHLIMLAPANHGSALAQLGKSTLSRIKFFFGGVAPGQQVLNWLELGSEGQWKLNVRALDYHPVANGLFPFVLTGQKIDRSLYDHLNSYTGEAGSDGVVRVAAANMNFNYFCLEQEGANLVLKKQARTERTGMGVLPGRSHSGEKIGIMASVGATDADPANPHPTVVWVLRCLKVKNSADYEQTCADLDALTAKTQADEKIDVEKKLVGTTTYETDQYCMLTFRLRDDRGQWLSDYDLYLTAGPNYDPNELPEGFFVDRQQNQLNHGHLTYFLNYTVMDTGLRNDVMQQKLGLRIVARPDHGLATYAPAELRSDLATLEQLLRPNETALIEITLRRNVDAAVFRLTENLQPEPISGDPSGTIIS